VRTLYRGGYLLTLDPAGTLHERGDLLVEDTRIAAVGAEGSVDAATVDRVVASERWLILPGMVNAHTHSNLTWVKGRYPGRPLELWRQFPRGSARALDDETRYLAAMLAHLEQLRTGATTAVDHFLVDPRALSRLVDSLGAKPGDRILEIGAGLGALTDRLIPTGAQITAVERDPRFVQVLIDRF